MDIPKVDPRKKHRRRFIGGGGVLLLAAGAVGIARLQPAAPTVEAAGMWTDTVRQGTMVREVRGPGTLVPEQIRYISAETAGRVERLLVEPGASVTPETELLLLSNSEVLLQAMEAQRQLAGAEASLANLRATLENQRLNQEGVVATVRSQHREAMRRIEVNAELAGRGLLASNELDRAGDTAEELATRLDIEEKRLDFIAASTEAQIAAQQAEIDRLRGLVRLQEEYVSSMRVLGGAHGVLRERQLEEGQWVNPGDRLAVVVQPGRLKAEVRIPESQAKDVVVGQRSAIDTRNGIVPGRVTRIDPTVVNGTVTVDVALGGELPKGARPDLSIDGTIEIERLGDVLHMDRPASGQAGSIARLFRVDPDGASARRVDVKLGRSSVNSIEIENGLRAGDVVILSDMSQWDAAEQVRIR